MDVREMLEAMREKPRGRVTVAQVGRVNLRWRLRGMRVSAGLRQVDLARQAGVSRQTVSNVERGTVSPTMETARRICRVLGCKVHELFAWQPEGEGGVGNRE